MPKITAFIAFPSGAEEVVEVYVSLIATSRILNVNRCGPYGPGPQGAALTVTFVLDGHEFVALNGGDCFTLSEAFSLAIPRRRSITTGRRWARAGNTVGAGG